MSIGSIGTVLLAAKNKLAPFLDNHIDRPANYIVGLSLLRWFDWMVATWLAWLLCTKPILYWDN